MQPLARRVFEAVAKAHCQPRKPDDRFSEDWFNALLAAVDPDKLALTAAAVQALSAHRYRLDNDLATPTAPVLDALFDLLSRRLAETETLLTALRAGPVSLQAPLNRPGPYADRAASDAERLQRLRAAARIDLWEQLAHRFVEGTVPAGEAALTQARTHEPKLRARLSATRLAFNCWQGVTGVAARRRALEALYLGTLTACFDPHTAWFSLDDQEAFVNAVSGLATGIGIQLEESAFDQLRIVRLVPGGPAWRSGQVAVGDAVVAVQDGDTWVRADETDADDFLEKLSRRAEMALTLRLRKGDGRETVVSLQAETLRDDESLVQGFVLAGGPRPVGYVRLPDFYSNEAADRHASCADDVARTLVKLQRDGIRGLILDLRYNGGGVMDEALQLAGLFIDQGPLALARTKPGERLVLKDPNRGTVYDGPLVVMTNAHSASASEFVAAALQDHRRAVLVGSRTHGKGSMQTLFPLERARPRRKTC